MLCMTQYGILYYQQINKYNNNNNTFISSGIQIKHGNNNITMTHTICIHDRNVKPQWLIVPTKYILNINMRKNN